MQKMNVVEVENLKVGKSLIVSTAFIEFTDNNLTDKTPETMIFFRFVAKSINFIGFRQRSEEHTSELQSRP